MKLNLLKILKYMCAAAVVATSFAGMAFAGSTWDFIEDYNFNFAPVSSGWSYTYVIPGCQGKTVQEANFDIEYKINSNYAGYAWYIDGENNAWLLGALNKSGFDSFVVPQAALDYMGKTGTFVIKLREDPDGAIDTTNTLSIGDTKVYGNYAAVPEFGSLPLAAMGIAPVAFILKRRKK